MLMLKDLKGKQSSVLLHSCNTGFILGFVDCVIISVIFRWTHMKSLSCIQYSKTWFLRLKPSLTVKTCQWRSLLNVSFCQGPGLIHVWETSWVSQNCNHFKLLNHCSAMSQRIFCFYWCRTCCYQKKKATQEKKRGKRADGQEGKEESSCKNIFWIFEILVNKYVFLNFFLSVLCCFIYCSFTIVLNCK